MGKLMVGIFGAEQDASLAVQQLVEEGIDKKDIMTVSKDEREVKMISEDSGIKKPQAALGSNGVLSTLKDLAADLDVAPREVSAAGTAAPIVNGADVGSRTDDLVLRFVEMGIPEEDARKYEEHIMMGHVIVLVYVQTKDWNRVDHIFNEHHSIAL